MIAFPFLEGLQLQIPVAFPYVITGRFGDPRDYAFAPTKLQKHEGVDFAPRHRDWPFLGVLPAFPGLVVKVGFDPRGYGNYIVLEHRFLDKVLTTWYGHMKTIYLKEGTAVPNLWLLGEAGTTGNATGAHLHFTLAYPGHGLKDYVVRDVIDPMPYFTHGYAL